MASSRIKDVAQLAEVSVATVSHVINETRFVTDATRQKVLAAIEELQYSPNILARKFKTGSRDTVAFVVPDIANRYFATLIEEVEDVLQADGFRLIVSNTREIASRELDCLRMLGSGVVDGFVIASTLTDYREIEAVLPKNFPVVLIDRGLANSRADTVTTDNSAAIHQGVSALIEQGHRKIGLMASVRRLSTTTERVHAYCAALEEHSLDVDEGMVRYLESITDPVGAAVDSLIGQGCTAIVASNNVLTNRLLAAVYAGSWPGRKIEILGYRDPARSERPGDALWIVEPIGEMGRLAGEAIVQRVTAPLAERRDASLQALLLTPQAAPVAP
jgi:LacI family transcriptional regulator